MSKGRKRPILDPRLPTPDFRSGNRAMSKDISRILERWDFEPENVIVRLVKGDDGRNKIQLRLDLGLLQMELDGRPDGLRPEGHKSWLEYYQKKQKLHDEANPDAAAFELDDEDCERLWREGIQYYHRYLSAWHLKLYGICARDTARNLRVFSFVRANAQEDRNKLQFDQWRPYVIMMNARSVATPLLGEGKYAEALTVIESGIDGIRDFLDDYNQGHRGDECVELMNLERWREDIVASESRAAEARPKTAVELLRRTLQEAVTTERFEEAARLRDEIRRKTKAEG